MEVVPLYPALSFHFPSHIMLLFQVCDVLAMAAHNLVSTIVLGFLTPPGVQLLVEDEVVDLHSSEEVTLVVYSARCLLAPYFWGLRVLLAEREAARLSGAQAGCRRLGGAGGLYVLPLSFVS